MKHFALILILLATWELFSQQATVFINGPNGTLTPVPIHFDPATLRLDATNTLRVINQTATQSVPSGRWVSETFSLGPASLTLKYTPVASSPIILLWPPAGIAGATAEASKSLQIQFDSDMTVITVLYWTVDAP